MIQMKIKKRSFYELEKENIPQNVTKKRKKFDKILIPKIKPNFLIDGFGFGFYANFYFWKCRIVLFLL